MEDILAKVKEFILRVENKTYKAKLIDIVKNGGLVFEIEGDIDDSVLNKKGEVSFNFENQNYSFYGKFFYLTPNKVVIQKTSSINLNKRTTTRIETSLLPCTITEKKKLLFVERKIIKGYILDLSKNGAKIVVKEPLSNLKKYKIETKLGKKIFSAIFQIRSSIEKGEESIYGIMFEEMDFQSQKILQRYIDEEEGKKWGEDIENIDFSKLWEKMKE